MVYNNIDKYEEENLTYDEYGLTPDHVAPAAARLQDDVVDAERRDAELAAQELVALGPLGVEARDGDFASCPTFDYLRAKGAVAPGPDAPAPEIAVRRLREKYHV